MKERFYFLACGLCMGIADVIPGVSGGTVAFLLGIYERLIAAIRAFDMALLKLVMQRDFKKAWLHIDGPFLCCVFGGIGISIFGLSKIMGYLLRTYPSQVQGFFFGLVVATFIVIVKSVRKKDYAKLALGFLSAVGMYYFVGMIPLQTPDNLAFLFVCGAVAICAMILPGISGAFVLLLLGKYQFIIDAVAHLNIIVLLAVAAGCAFGLLSFVRVLHWVLARYHDITLSILAGVVLGSLRKIWPWKECIRFLRTPHGRIIPVEEINVLPQSYDLALVAVIALCLLGIGIGLFLGRETKGIHIERNH